MPREREAMSSTPSKTGTFSFLLLIFCVDLIINSQLRCLQGKCQIVFDPFIEVGLFHFMYIDFLSFAWNLVTTESLKQCVRSTAVCNNAFCIKLRILK